MIALLLGKKKERVIEAPPKLRRTYSQEKKFLTEQEVEDEEEISLLNMNDRELIAYLRDSPDYQVIFNTIKLCHKIFNNLREENDSLKDKNEELENKLNNLLSKMFKIRQKI